MKEKKDMLEKGLLERYVLGELKKDKRLELEKELDLDPGLRNSLQQIEEDLERVAMENAVAPPDQVKQQLIRQIREDEEVLVKPLRNQGRASVFFLKIAAALAVLLLLSSFWLYQKVNTLENELNIVRSENSELQESYIQTIAELEGKEQWYVFVNDPDTEKLVMEGNRLSPETKAVAFINHEIESVFVNTAGLAELPGDKDYQLWSDVGGEMIDMGVIPKDRELAMMSYIRDAESLNITIEPRGGSDHPTVSKLISAVRL